MGLNHYSGWISRRLASTLLGVNYRDTPQIAKQLGIPVLELPGRYIKFSGTDLLRVRDQYVRTGEKLPSRGEM
jgi:hypothetical protein